jgi:hypothetical protein
MAQNDIWTLQISFQISRNFWGHAPRKNNDYLSKVPINVRDHVTDIFLVGSRVLPLVVEQPVVPGVVGTAASRYAGQLAVTMKSAID